MRILYALFLVVLMGCGAKETTKETITTKAPVFTCLTYDLSGVSTTGTASMSGLSAMGTIQVPSINMGQLNQNDSYYGLTTNFGLKCVGIITVDKGGTHSFRLRSDDGSMLYVNGIAVVNHDGLHSFSMKSGSVTLVPGDYTVEVHFVQQMGPKGLILTVVKPGSSYEELVTPSK